MSENLHDYLQTSNASWRTAGADGGESSLATGVFGARSNQTAIADGRIADATRALRRSDANVARIGRLNHHISTDVVANMAVVPFGDHASGSVESAKVDFLQARGGLTPRTLRRVHEYIAAHLEEHINLQGLARVAGLSMYHFARAFKQSERVTPHQFLLQCRVRRAQELLVATSLSLAEVAHAAGFSDQSHCARRFREFVGTTPSRYRRWMR